LRGICYNNKVMVKKIAILGSTGSIGKNALRVIDGLGPEYRIVALSAHSNIELLAEQARKYRPKVIAVTGADYVEPMRDLVSELDVEVFGGAGGLKETVEFEEIDIVLTAVVGAGD